MNHDKEILKFYVIATTIISLLILLCLPCFAEDMDLTRAVIHHTASPDVSVATIDQWHKDRGWDGVGYHFVIRKDGTIEKGRSLSKKGAHAKGRNHLVGIALTGYDKFTVSQLTSLRELLGSYGITRIERHHEECPGKGINVEEIQRSLNDTPRDK